MKKKNLMISGSVAVVVMMAATGVAMTTFAAENISTTTNSANVQRFRPMSGIGGGLSEAQRSEMKAKRDAFKAERETTRLAIQAALEVGDYDAWVKVMPTDSPMLAKINKDNFSQLVEAHKLMKQSGEIMKGLGIERGDMMGGKHRGHGGFLDKK